MVIILTRAGLDLDPTALRRLKVTVPKMSLIPWVVEATVVAALTKYLLDLPWIWGFLLGSIIAAVSPAVVVSCLFRLRAKGYGVAKVKPFIQSFVEYSLIARFHLSFKKKTSRESSGFNFARFLYTPGNEIDL